jgi:hypothetical protein
MEMSYRICFIYFYFAVCEGRPTENLKVIYRHGAPPRSSIVAIQSGMISIESQRRGQNFQLCARYCEGNDSQAVAS